MQFIDFLIHQLVEEHNNRSAINAMGLVDHPDLDPGKGKRYRYGCYMIQPPVDLKQKSPKERLKIYKEMQNFFNVLYDGIQAIIKKDLSDVFAPPAVQDEDPSLSVWRLIYDKGNEYAELYQQENDDNDNQWERGDFIWNLGAVNDNIHTLVHAIGHQHYYECLTDEQAEEWKDFYELRKQRGKNEFVSEYAKENHREDYAETFAVYVLGKDKINSLYDRNRISKDVAAVQKILSKFKRMIFVKKKKGKTRGAAQ